MWKESVYKCVSVWEDECVCECKGVYDSVSVSICESTCE